VIASYVQRVIHRSVTPLPFRPRPSANFPPPSTSSPPSPHSSRPLGGGGEDSPSDGPLSRFDGEIALSVAPPIAPAAAHTAIQPGIAATRRAPVPSRLLAASGSADFVVRAIIPFLCFFAFPPPSRAGAPPPTRRPCDARGAVGTPRGARSWLLALWNLRRIYV